MQVLMLDWVAFFFLSIDVAGAAFYSPIVRSTERERWVFLHRSRHFSIPTASLINVGTPNDGSSSFSFFDMSKEQINVKDFIFEVQRSGETIFAALLFIAMVQAYISLILYRTNPKGELMVPPGLTYGTVRPPVSAVEKAEVKEESSISLAENQQHALLPSSAKLSSEQSRYTRFFQRINRGLVLLLPWASQTFRWIPGRNRHLFHFGFIMTVAGLFDLPNRWWIVRPSTRITNEAAMEGNNGPGAMTSGSTRESTMEIKDEEAIKQQTAASSAKRIHHLIVIGDSLAVGLGSVNVYDPSKMNDAPFCLLENTDTETTYPNAPGPVFPRALAETLANVYQDEIHWRSAGVDGGDVAMIQDYCLQVVQDEVDKGRPPDAVVVLCGINDLKYFVSNPFQGPGPRVFQRRLHELIKNIHSICGLETKIILPMFPTTQMFPRASSPLNIFPLNFFFDSIVGFWDSQKKLVADQSWSDSVLYIGLRPSEIYDWYKTIQVEQKDKDVVKEGLIAADGVHPNARCYALWGKFLGEQLAAQCS